MQPLVEFVAEKLPRQTETLHAIRRKSNTQTPSLSQGLHATLMNTIQIISSQGDRQSLSDQALLILQHGSQNHDFLVSAMCTVRNALPAASEKQLISVAALMMKPATDFLFALENQLQLVVDQNALVHWSQNSSFHPEPYHFVWAADESDHLDEKWLLLEGASLKPGKIRVAMLETAHALAAMCERRLIDLKFPGKATCPTVDWPSLDVRDVGHSQPKPCDVSSSTPA